MDLSKYVGREYEDYNCFDLAKEFYRDFYDLNIQHYFEGERVPPKHEIECLIKSSIGDFEKVQSPKFGDVIAIKLYGYTSHIGIYVGEGEFLHSIQGTGSCLDKISRYERMIDGYYRHREQGICLH